MRAHSHVRQNILLLLALSGTAVLLGAAISVLSESASLRLLVIVPVAAAGLVLAISSVPALLVKGATLAAGLRWWHALWFLALLSGLSFRGRTIEAIHETPVDFWAGWRIGLVGLIALVLLSRLASRTADWTAGLLRGLPLSLLLYGLVSLISTLWSVYPMWTLYKSIEYLLDVAMLAAVVTMVTKIEDIKSLFDWTWVLYGLLLLTVWLSVFLRPEEAVQKGAGLIGIVISGIWPWISSNGVGDLAGTLLIVAATRLLCRERHRSFYWLVSLTALVTLILAQSRSPFTGALLGLVAVLLLRRRFGLLALVALAGGALVALTPAETVVQQAFMRGQSPDDFYSLSGRVGYWTAAWEVVRENPFLGLGAYAAGRFAVLGSLGASVTATSSLHNAWLEILVGVGLIGFLPFLATLIGIWVNLLRVDSASTPPMGRELRIEIVGILVLLCFRSIFTVEFIWHPPLVFLLALAYAELLRRARLKSRAASPLPWQSAWASTNCRVAGSSPPWPTSGM
jgi:O-antigen ligase